MILNKQLLSCALALVLVSAIGVCGAQTVDASMQAKLTELETRFKAADKNADGQLTLEEAKNGMPRIADSFARIDTEKKGYVTLDQIKAMLIKNGG